MKKNTIYIIMVLMAAMTLSACQSEDFSAQKPDEFYRISFGVNSEQITSRAGAEHDHIAYDPAKHASTMGVFGYCDGDISTDANKIFENQKVTHDSGSPIKWSYTPEKWWPDYTSFKSFDFFGYMVDQSNPATDPLPGATVANSGNTYTLSFPASISKPIIFGTKAAPLICHEPNHQTVTGNVINFEMDQTLTGYKIQFQLGDKMDALRNFVINSVKIYGENLPTGGIVSRTYTLTDGTWTAGDVTWTDLSTTNVPSGEKAIEIEKSWAEQSGTKPYRTVNNTYIVKWGGAGITDGAFYAIPDASFNPTIEVTYDVYTDTDGNGDGNYTLDRKDVKSTIILNSTNFSALANGNTGEINIINIKIVPSYLYVLSDDDQATGFLIAE